MKTAGLSRFIRNPKLVEAQLTINLTIKNISSCHPEPVEGQLFNLLNQLRNISSHKFILSLCHSEFAKNLTPIIRVFNNHQGTLKFRSNI
jgi:hypothetical protein